MKRELRQVIFFLFLLLFLVGAPAIVLYTAGYRLNLTTLRVQQTGVIAVSSTPRGATILLNGVDIGNKTPFVIQHLAAGEYDVTISRDGYTSWSDHVTVSPGNTTYTNATLFADALPELVLAYTAVSVTGDHSGRFLVFLTEDDGVKHLERFDTVTNRHDVLTVVPKTAISVAYSLDETFLLVTHDVGLVTAYDAGSGALLSDTETLQAINPLSEYVFIDNGINIELRNTTSNTLVALLPPNTYTPVLLTDELAVFRDTRGQAYLLSRRSDTIELIRLPSLLLAENKNEPILAGTDGSEVALYARDTKATTLLTRQSERIIGIVWDSTNTNVLCATNKSIFALPETLGTTRNTITLVNNAQNIMGLWRDTTGKHILFYGEVDGVLGVYRVALTR